MWHIDSWHTDTYTTRSGEYWNHRERVLCKMIVNEPPDKYDHVIQELTTTLLVAIEDEGLLKKASTKNPKSKRMNSPNIL